ncbi:MAG: DNA cytosine methyltransferase [Alphaproteobacteria bacterium]|nr:DNA cytosine methyltransferase [Alphaproteobacteria bacterium]
MKAIELFAGAGGLGIGIGRAGFRPERIVEWEPNCQRTLLANRRARQRDTKGWPLDIESDVRDADFTAHEGRVELISGGPPCQPFSVGGRHLAHADRRDMFPEAVRAVREAKPRTFIFENVRGLTRERFSSYYEYIKLQMQYPELVAKGEEDWSAHLRRLERHHTGSRADRGLEYSLVAEVLNAADYGVPQKRHRVFFVGFRKDKAIEWSFPEATHSQDALLWEQAHGQYFDRHGVPRRERWCNAERIRARAERMTERPTALPWVTVRDALATLPDPEHGIGDSPRLTGHRFQPGAKSYPGHTGSPLDDAAKALKAGVHGVPGGENMLARADGSVRYFTVRESARLQTFPDSYRIEGVWSEAMRQLGNAVPVTLAERVARSVAVALENSDTTKQ